MSDGRITATRARGAAMVVGPADCYDAPHCINVVTRISTMQAARDAAVLGCSPDTLRSVSAKPRAPTRPRSRRSPSGDSCAADRRRT